MTEKKANLTLTEKIAEDLQMHVDYLSQQVWDNLSWIAAGAVCEYGVEPTFEQVLHEAFPIAQAPELYIFDYEEKALLDEEAREEPSTSKEKIVRGYDDRKGVTTRQFNSIMRNADFVLKNLETLKEYAAQGIKASTTQEERFAIARDNRRKSFNKWRSDNDQREYLRRSKLSMQGREAVKKVAVL